MPRAGSSRSGTTTPSWRPPAPTRGSSGSASKERGAQVADEDGAAHVTGCVGVLRVPRRAVDVVGKVDPIAGGRQEGRKMRHVEARPVARRSTDRRRPSTRSRRRCRPRRRRRSRTSTRVSVDEGAILDRMSHPPLLACKTTVEATDGAPATPSRTRRSFYDAYASVSACWEPGRARAGAGELASRRRPGGVEARARASRRDLRAPPRAATPPSCTARRRLQSRP